MSPRARVPGGGAKAERPPRTHDRQRRLRLTPVDLPPPESDEPPFLRPERRMRVRRARRSHLSRLALALQAAGGALVAVFVLWGAYGRVMADERLRVARVDVQGGRFLSEAEVRELLGPAVGENILSLDIAQLTSRLRASPWVAEATVARRLPDTLRVQVRERTPLALAELERLYLMDGEGVLIDLYGPRTAAFDLPIVRGLARADEQGRRQRAHRAGELLSDLGPLAAVVSEVEVDAAGEVVVVLGGAGERLRLGRPPYRERLLAFLGLREEMAKRCPDAEWFDLRFKDRIYARRGGRWPEREETVRAEAQPPLPPAAVVPGAVPPSSPAPESPPASPPSPSGPSGEDTRPSGAAVRTGRAQPTNQGKVSRG